MFEASNQSSDRRYDVIVVGGSIAGCTTAIFLARHGLSVALLERSSDPMHFKLNCNHVIQPSANGTFRRLGVLERLREKGAARHQVEAWSPYGWLPWDDTLESGCNLRREVLDPLLRDHAANTPGVTLLLGYNVTELLFRDERAEGVIAKDSFSQHHEFKARLVVGADGRKSRVAALAKVPTQTTPNGRAYYFGYYEGVELAGGEASMVWWNGPDVAMCFHTDSDLIVLGCMPSKDKLPLFRKDVEGCMLRFFEQLPHGPRMARARRVSDMRGVLDMPNQVRPAAACGVALVGDAALTSDPMVGVGCTWALESAEWLAQHVGPALVEQADLDEALQSYARVHAARLHPHHEMIARTSVGRPFNLMERLLLSSAARDRDMTRELQRLSNRLAQPRDVVTVRLLLRMLWVNLVRKPLLIQRPRSHSHLAKGPGVNSSNPT